MSKSIRINTTPLGNDKHLKVKIDQDFDFLEILSLKITQTEAYTKYCSDYGVVVGRVVVNNGFGIPNAKISIFIPLAEEDKSRPEINGLYPFETIYTKDYKGIRYNLLSNEPRPDDECHVAVGTFPDKRQVLDCGTTLEVFEKYYKFTTTTNSAGDYMIFGAPVGEHTIHVDLSDIGFISQKPYELIGQGFSKNLFASNSQFKTGQNLDVLSQIKSRNTSASVIPFWGDLEECEVGITRVDFDLNYDIIPTAIFIGNIFGDNEKNSVNKRCRPRRKLGNLCETVTGEGTIEMIRKTPEGLIEKFSVDGDNLINENGVWCYQIPMNLDKLVTDEFGNLVPSEDPEKGVPSNAKVRFRVAMNETGDTGRIRSRAKFLIPNRGLDYNFDDSTPDTEFADLRWKKVYTVRQFIARYQKYCETKVCGTKRSFIGIKDVDDCGDHTPFPYNRIDTDLNPLYSIICLIVTILMTLIELINVSLIRLLNIVIGALNAILCFICNIIYGLGQFIDSIVSAINGLIPGNGPLSFNVCNFCIGTGCCTCGSIMNYMSCISIKCDEKSFAPGCYKPSSCSLPSGCSIPSDVDKLGWCTANSGQPPENYPGDGVTNQIDCGSYNASDAHGCCGPAGSGFIPFAGAMDCIEIQLARALNVFKFDFYNDWINGSLYAFLFKYKVRRKKSKKRTVEKFCEYDCHDTYESDTDSPEHKYNKCRDNLFLVDTCVANDNNPISFNKVGIDEGIIKEHKDELYYAAMTHDTANLLYATDITCLGSAVNCDIDGRQKIVTYLVNTSYKMPPDTAELDSNNVLETTAIDPLLLSLNCFRVKVEDYNCKNIKRICEIGIGLDENRVDDTPPGVAANCNIEIFDSPITIATTEELEGEFLRNELGSCATGIYQFDCTQEQTDYNIFRGYNNPNPLGLPTENSYFYYFGINPGKSALDCAMASYFVPCKRDKQNQIPAQITTIDNTCNNQNAGSVTVNLLGGKEPFTYTFADTNSNSILGSPSSPTTSNFISFTNLFAGSYQLSVTDKYGDNSLYNININEPLSLIAVPTSVQNTTSPILSNGSIDINVFGGNPPYTYLWSPGGQTTQDLSGIGVGVYNVTIKDTATPTCSQQTITLTGLTIASPSALNFNYTTVPSSCYNQGDAQIVLSNITGGTSPYTIFINGTLTTSSIGNLTGNTSGIPYTITVYDSTSAQTVTQIVTLTSPPLLTATAVPGTILCNGCTTNITVNPNGGTSPYTYKWNDSNNQTTQTALNLSEGTYVCMIKDAKDCEYKVTTTITAPPKLDINNVFVTNAVCFNGTAQVSFNLAGGTGNLSYAIYNAALNTTLTPTCNNCNTPTSTPCTSSCVSSPGTLAQPITSNVTPGTYTFNIPHIMISKQYYMVVTDTNGCKTCTTFIVTSPPQLSGLFTYNLTNSIPFKQYSLNITGIGGTLTTSYTINLYNSVLGNTNCNLSTTPITPNSFTPTTKDYINLGSGEYIIQIKDDNNCLWCSSTFTLPS
jgi:hypothetical protein